MNLLPPREVVLVGAGHTNLHVVRMWGAKPIEGARLTLISAQSRAAYSGMLPGTLAGLYDPEEMLIDLCRLTSACGVRLVVDKAVGLDPVERLIECADRAPLPFDVASVGLGSIPAQPEIWAGNPRVVAIKPMVTFRQRLLLVLSACARARLGGPAVLAKPAAGTSGCQRPAQPAQRVESLARCHLPLRVVVVGAGAGGTEIAFCLNELLCKMRDETGVAHHQLLIESNAEILAGYLPGTIRLARRELARRQISIMTGKRVAGIIDAPRDDAACIQLEGSETVLADLVVWAAAAAAPPELSAFHLPKASDQFLAVRPTLLSTSGFPVFGVGDSATIEGQAIPKAGVHAVRQGPILWRNINRLLSGAPLREYHPQRSFLSILAMGNGRAIAQYKGFSADGPWAWRWKDFIDRRFMRKHEVHGIRRMRAADRAAADGDAAGFPGAGARGGSMRCDGCAAKVDAEVLSTALRRLGPLGDSRVVCGLNPFDDAVVVDRNSSPIDLFTVDFFPAFLDDPYLVGRVAALNALSDIWAMGGRATGALAIVALPSGAAARQSDLLFQLLSGAARELRAAGAALWGGHTIQGPELTIGFSVAGQLDGLLALQKGAVRPGDQLLLTKPLGTGALLAAHRLGKCRAVWVDAMLRAMLQGNQKAAQFARESGVLAATDVTGFGLVGHLREMLAPRGLAARLSLSSIPLLDGFAEVTRQGIRASLHDANRAACGPSVFEHPQLEAMPEFDALFDPQTSGGLLLAAAPGPAAELAARISDATGCAAVIGEVTFGPPGQIELRESWCRT